MFGADEMEFEWDPEKENVNITKHGVSFDEAMSVFYDALSLTYPDPDHSVRENRSIIVGMSNKPRLLFISHIDKGNHIRIISARELTRKERKQYEDEGKD